MPSLRKIHKYLPSVRLPFWSGCFVAADLSGQRVGHFPEIFPQNCRCLMALHVGIVEHFLTVQCNKHIRKTKMLWTNSKLYTYPTDLQDVPAGLPTWHPHFLCCFWSWSQDSQGFFCKIKGRRLLDFVGCPSRIRKTVRGGVLGVSPLKIQSWLLLAQILGLLAGGLKLSSCVGPPRDPLPETASYLACSHSCSILAA